MDEQKLLDWWLPPQGAGEPVSCLATSFTFDTDFFRDDCLGRFIGLRGAVGEEGVGSLAQINELEERLAHVSACVLVDRSASVEGRNLRWDVIPTGVAGGLLHAKTAVLIWENTARVIIGSANLTPAGYRYQREIAVAFDLDQKSPVPSEFWLDYLSALRDIVNHAPSDLTSIGPKVRAELVLSQLEERIAIVGAPRRTAKNNVHVVYSKKGESAVDQIRAVFTGLKPRKLTALSPFWDTEDLGASDAVRSLTSLLAEKGDTEAEFMVPLEVSTTGSLVHAPADLINRVSRRRTETSLMGVTSGMSEVNMERRRLHAKALSLESSDSLLVMVGSSNITTAGLGLSPHFGHLELNVAYITAAAGKTARGLRALFPTVIPVDSALPHAPQTDPEEDLNRPILPRGFVNAIINKIEGEWEILVKLEPRLLPSDWSVEVPALGLTLFSSESAGDSPEISAAIGNPKVLPQGLSVHWTEKNGHKVSADWVLNISNPADLPLDERLRAVPIDLIIEALSKRSTNPAALLDRLLDGLSDMSPEQLQEIASPLDPLKSYDDSRALLKRIGVYGRALDELQKQLSRPVPTLSALGWRLTGLISPTRIAEGWVEQANEGNLPIEVAHFLFAELLLSMKRVDWASVTSGLEEKDVQRQLSEAFARWDSTYSQLEALPAGHELIEYVTAARSLT